ncbi:MAG: hypothetical protein L3J33_02555 [Rhodobacteraceae bacterium]|nr:hypothetical protein [Paracoccaceae bacterium]
MNIKKSFLAITLFAMLGATSACEIFATEQEVVDPATGEITIVPVAPREPYSGSDRGTGGGGGWG